MRLKIFCEFLLHSKEFLKPLKIQKIIYKGNFRYKRIKTVTLLYIVCRLNWKISFHGLGASLLIGNWRGGMCTGTGPRKFWSGTQLEKPSRKTKVSLCPFPCRVTKLWVEWQAPRLKSLDGGVVYSRPMNQYSLNAKQFYLCLLLHLCKGGRKIGASIVLRRRPDRNQFAVNSLLYSYATVTVTDLSTWNHKHLSIYGSLSA